MSAQDQGDDDKGFLARWSQRKQAARQPEREAPVADAGIAAAPQTEAEAGPEFDLSSLPSLDELTSETDITGFLRKGVPEHLRNAALRKSWALDPAIRNYVNPALDYAYDWNTPGGVPGSSELGTGLDVARMVSQIMGVASESEPSVSTAEITAETVKAAEVSTEPRADVPDQPLRLSHQSAPIGPSEGDEDGAVKAEQMADGKSDSVASQHTVRRHGSAKPTI